MSETNCNTKKKWWEGGGGVGERGVRGFAESGGGVKF